MVEDGAGANTGAPVYDGAMKAYVQIPGGVPVATGLIIDNVV